MTAPIFQVVQITASSHPDREKIASIAFRIFTERKKWLPTNANSPPTASITAARSDSSEILIPVKLSRMTRVPKTQYRDNYLPSNNNSEKMNESRIKGISMIISFGYC